MSIRDIIKAATKNRWWIGSCCEDSEGLHSGDVPIIYVDFYGNFQVNKNDENFITTFNPEHVALMEAVIEAGTIGDDYPDWAEHPLDISIRTLEAYRKERGLND